MTDTNKLKELAQAANRARRQWYNEDDCCWWTGNVDEGDFIAAANPQAIIGLIAEIAGIKAEAEFWNAAAVSHLEEVDRLKAENEALRKLLDSGRYYIPENKIELLGLIDAALEGGGNG